MVTNWAELKFATRLKKWANKARDRVRAKNPEFDAEMRSREKKKWVRNTLTNPGFSKLSFTVVLFLAACIVVSTIAFILETVPAYERAPGWGNYFFYLECFFVAVFTIEVLLKFWSTKDTTFQFFKDPLNVVDILAICPFYVELFLIMFVGGKVAMWDLRGLRAFRLMRMLKMGQFSGDLQLLAEGLVRARISIAMLFITLFLGMIVFAVLMWVTERGIWNANVQCYARPGELNFNGCSPFQSVPFGFWWALTTMTTVGYGDAFPITPTGKFIGGLAMVAGIFCVALPTGILCAEFSKLYEERHNVRKELVITHELQMRPKVELEVFLDSEKITKVRHDIAEQLDYMNRLAAIYVESSNKTNANVNKRKSSNCVERLYTTFQNEATESLDALRMLVMEVCDELQRVRSPLALNSPSGRTPRYVG